MNIGENPKIAKALKGNKNAEKWNEEISIDIFSKAVEMSKEETTYIINGKKITGYKYHFIGEIASQLDLYRDLFLYLSKKFDKCKNYSDVLLNRLEANCFADSKRGVIKEATAIMNLKSNYGWTDRLDNTTKGASFNGNIIIQSKGDSPEVTE